jgi:hypothetical protein
MPWRILVFLREAYPRLVKRAMELLISFATIYFSESGNLNRLGVQHDMRVALSKTTPQLMFLFKLSNNNLQTDTSLKK